MFLACQIGLVSAHIKRWRCWFLVLRGLAHFAYAKLADLEFPVAYNLGEKKRRKGLERREEAQQKKKRRKLGEVRY